MNLLDRRHFLFASSGAAAGTFVASGLAHATDADSIEYSQSGLVTGTPKPLKHNEIPGFLSAQQIASSSHGALRGAPKALVAADAKLEQATKSGTAVDAAAFAHLKRLVNSRGK